ncbi:MAG: hypothetical protein CMJ16_05365 [Peredibacter sp.]|nr:hypothetical protein [Peredibacter sp.]|tara:strand:+ start:2287 stop:2610 length:324 start_codon:yes stop_codon:yes gene_type:complete
MNILRKCAPDLEVSIPSFLDNTFQNFVRLKMGFEGGDLEEVKFFTGNILGSASAYGLTSLAQLCREILDDATNGSSWRSLRPLMIELDSYFYNLEKNHKEISNFQVC